MIAYLMTHVRGEDANDELERRLLHRRAVLRHFSGDPEMVEVLKDEPAYSTYVEYLFEMISTGRANELS